MNRNYFTSIHIRKQDFFKLPPDMRKFTDGPMVLSRINGKATFVPAIVIG